MSDVLVLNIPAGIKLNAPIQIIHINTNKENVAVYNRLLVKVGDGAELTLKQSHVSLESVTI